MYYSDFVKHGEVSFQRDETYLAHFGIKGQKWGVRRFQNPDGSLTEAGKKRYDKLTQKAHIEANKIFNRTQHIPYNKAADKINNGLIQKYNNSWIKKHGENDFENPKYYEGYQKMWNDLYQKEIDKYYDEILKNTKEYKLAQEMLGK